MDCSPPGSSVHVIFQARMLEYVAIPFSRWSSQRRDPTWDSCTARFFTDWATKEALYVLGTNKFWGYNSEPVKNVMLFTFWRYSIANKHITKQWETWEIPTAGNRERACPKIILKIDRVDPVKWYLSQDLSEESHHPGIHRVAEQKTSGAWHTPGTSRRKGSANRMSKSVAEN